MPRADDIEPKEFAPSLLDDLYSVCSDIFDRWDTDQRSGKLLRALQGDVRDYDPRVTRIRAALAQPLEPRPDRRAHHAVAELVDAALWLADNAEIQSSSDVRRVRDAIAAIEHLPTEIERLRAEQAEHVMPTIGPLIDAWMDVPNDLRGDLAEATPSFISAMGSTIRAIGSEFK